MSKAFTKEDDSAPPPVTDRPAPPGEPLITPAGFARLQQELAQLRAVPAEAPGREERERQLRYLTARVETVKVVAPTQEQQGSVYLGAHVRLEDEDGTVRSYQIVGPDELDVAAGKVTVESPLGRALLGRAVGDAVTVARPRGPLECEVKEIWYEEA